MQGASGKRLIIEHGPVVFTYCLQHSASQRSAISWSESQGDAVYLLAAGLREPEVSNFLVRELWLALYTYRLQHSMHLSLAVVLSKSPDLVRVRLPPAICGER